MSTEQVDPDLLEQTKNEIRGLIREIAQFSKSDMEPLDYYEAVLQRVMNALASVGAAVWMLNESGRLELEYQVNLPETGLVGSQEDQARHGRLLHKLIRAGEPALVLPHAGAGDAEEGGNPTECLLLLGPLKTEKDAQGIIEVFHRPGGSLNAQRGYLRFVQQVADMVSDFLKSRKLKHYTDRQTLWSQLETFTRVAHRSLDPKTTAFVVANEGRRLIECDRVSVAIVKGKKAIIQAISNQDVFDKRSNTVTLLGRLATAVVATGEPMWYTGDTSDMAPQVEEAVQEYVDEAHSKTIAVIPLKRPHENPAEAKPDERPPVIGALIVEQIEDSRPREGLMQRIEVVSEHSSLALANALEYHDLFLLPVWRAIGKAKWVVEARTLPKTLAITAAVLTVLIGLAVVPADFTLQGKGALQPVNRCEVFAPHEGEVVDVLVKHGDNVEKGQVLARMRSRELDQSIAGAEKELNMEKESLDVATLSSSNRDVSSADKAGAEGKAQEAKIKLVKLQVMLNSLREQQESLVVRSPMSGQVTTWDVDHLLRSRPVQRGQAMISIVDPSKDWELEINMPESRMGHIVSAQIAQGEPLNVDYILATRPGDMKYGKVAEIHRSAEVRGEEGNTVVVKVAINQHDLPERPRRGATVTAKIHCGRTSIGYKWFHDLIAWVEANVIFPMW